MGRKHHTFEDEEVYGPEQSASGKNAYYFRCEAVEHNSAYASCLSKIAERKNGRLETIYSTCSVEIGQRRCPAMAMQKQEKEVGHALFYLDRAKLREFYSNEEYAPTSAKSKWQNKPVQQLQQTIRSATSATNEENGFAAAINAAMAEHQSKPKSAKIEPIAENLAGLSMLQIARLRAAQKVSHQ